MERNLHTGHRQRVKDRAISEGLDGFEEYQILELLLFYSIPRKDTNEIAHKLIEHFGSLANVLDATVNDLCRVEGITQNSALLLSMLPDLTKRYQMCKGKDKIVIGSSKAAGEYASNLFTGKLYEAFYMICLDSQNRVKHALLLHEGTINEAPVYPRNIVENALRYQAVSVILAHNHPGGSLRPSQEDLNVTQRIKSAMEPISIAVIDHIIVSENQFYSFAENGVL
ncbi:DNA repair protein RadC [Eubacteriaceae bacterium ES2]|nr:DNA repair protein RadC [Eubacteriaceae bacterium ES2]